MRVCNMYVRMGCHLIKFIFHMLQVIDSGTVEIILCGRKFMMDNTSGYLMENYAYVCYSMLKNCQDHDYCINDTFFFF